MDNPQINPVYPRQQLARALSTALTHEDPEVRLLAENRVSAWNSVTAGMADGSLEIGSRTPVRDLPTWVTLEVAQGGFATGRPAAGGPLNPHEAELAARHGLPARRRAVFEHHLGESGLAELTTLLDSGDYELGHPEEAALLTVAWLLRAGDAPAALRLLKVLEPFTGTLCFTPRPLPGARAGAGTGSGVALAEHSVHRATVGQVADKLHARATHPRASVKARTQSEALTIWAPFSDRILSHWLATTDPGGRVDAHRPDGWAERSRGLLAEYARLAAEHTLCTKHRRPKENLAILLAALHEATGQEGSVPENDSGGVGGPGAPSDSETRRGSRRGPTPEPAEPVEPADPASTELSPRRRGLLQCSVDAMLRKRGRPGDRQHTAVRRVQAAQAARPTHDDLARLLCNRLNALPRHTGTTRMSELVLPVSLEEAAEHGLPVAWPFPEYLRATVLPAMSAPLAELIKAGVVPSAEVVAQVIPLLVARAEASAAPDQALTHLTAAHHRAFSQRRSLLLADLSAQVRSEELPWVRALAPHLSDRNRRREAARALLPRIGSTVLTAFPGTITPNPLVRQFAVLAHAADMDAPFVEELAADIFTGRLSPKFLRAARLAAERTRGGLYARYYGLDPEQLPSPAQGTDNPWTASGALARLCQRRAGDPSGGVAAAGMVIEQAQILTTHNLALLEDLGASPDQGWAVAAWDAYETVVGILDRLPRVEGRLGHVKNAAFAWRQCVYFLSRCSEEEQRAALDRMTDRIAYPRHTREILTPILAGLRQAVAGHSPVEEEGRVRLFLGWSNRRHWVLRALREAAPRG
ncbi:transcriptional regulator [Nocardiopsis exhalans]|uniref:Transcriptional regulator n=1 Tax=Nocardiopsis exhalans TaxID=163604 RepID=A0ABY5DH43_9ACTN|nr:transcriptional regulator [Nocardiopsis exhalans]USY22704.1 transcriptional regulator [Nocardiopsis exhalans]